MATALASAQETPSRALVGVSVTQFYQTGINSSGAGQPVYGARIDLNADVSARALGLWSGLGLHARVAGVYAGAGRGTYGSILPINAALPLNPNDRSELDVSLHLAQSVGSKVLVSIGKFDMFEIGGRGVDRFLNLELVAPFSGVTPPSVLGAAVQVKAGIDALTLMVYDPADQTGRAGFANVFDRGVTYAGTMRFATEYRGLPGQQSFSAAYSSEDGLEFADLVDMRLPGNVRMRGRDHRWYLAYSFGQTVARGVTWFGQLAWTDGNPNPMQWSFVSSVSGEKFGVGVFYLNLSMQARHALSSWAQLSDDVGAEMFYTIEAGRKILVTPDVQIINGAQAGSGVVMIGGLRARVVL